MASNIVVPEVGESIVDARVAKWLRREGDQVAAGDPLVELETDKIDLEVSAPQAGVLAKITRQDGEDVKVGEVLGVIEEAGAAAAARPCGSRAPKLHRPRRRRQKPHPPRLRHPGRRRGRHRPRARPPRTARSI